MRLGIGILLLFMALLGDSVLAAEDRETVAGLPAAEALRLGGIMYHKGQLPSGNPMPALVQGGIEMDGNMCSCTNCHMSSGLGSLEGGIVSPPTSGAKIYAPLRGQKDIPGSTMTRSMFKNPPRPAYTDESLATMMLTGVDPTGRTLSEVMPRYLLDDKEMAIMIHYLRNLSSTVSPGVTREEIRFATVVTADVSPEDRESLLQPLRAFIRDDWNGRLKALNNQWNGVWNNSVAPPEGNVFRKIELDVWELKGSPDTWELQLDAYYRQKPVFAMLGGITGGTWAPVHDYCEKNRIPCILPITDLPVISENNRYTLYISKGLYGEGEAAAKYLSRVFTLPADKQIVQVFRETMRGRALARGFTDTWGKLGKGELGNRVVQPSEKIDAEFWKKLSSAYPGAVLLLWLDPSDLATVGTLAGTENKPLFFSATLLAGAYAALPDTIRDAAFIMYPFRLAEEQGYSRTTLNNWLKLKSLSVSNEKTASQVLLLKSVLSDALYNTGSDYYREFFLDNLDQSRDQTQTSITYPNLSFGPGQRYASKGCYVVTLTKGDKPKLVRQSDWVIY